jgi:hypothetical protein
MGPCSAVPVVGRCGFAVVEPSPSRHGSVPGAYDVDQFSFDNLAVAGRGDRQLRVEYRPPGSLTPRPHNARIHTKKQIRQVAESIRVFGFTNPILLDGGNTIIAGQWPGRGRQIAGDGRGAGDPTCRTSPRSRFGPMS